MDLSFLTPEVFNIIIMINLIVGVVLVVWRFTRDMRRPVEQPRSQQMTRPMDDPFIKP